MLHRMKTQYPISDSFQSFINTSTDDKIKTQFSHFSFLSLGTLHEYAKIYKIADVFSDEDYEFS